VYRKCRITMGLVISFTYICTLKNAECKLDYSTYSEISSLIIQKKHEIYLL
jgi:hypothetical protein